MRKKGQRMEKVERKELQDQLGCIGRLYLRLLCSKLCCTPPNRLLINGTHDKEVRNGRDGDVQVCKDVRDSQRKDKLITCGNVSIAIYNRFYHV